LRLEIELDLGVQLAFERVLYKDPLPPIFLVMVVRMLVHMAMLWAKMLSSLLRSKARCSGFYSWS